MTKSKSILTISTLAFALMFGGGVYLFTQMNVLAKSMAEEIASEALGVKVSIGSLDISLPEKRVEVNNIRIANPKGFKNPHAIVVQKAAITLAALGENLIDFQSIKVQGPVVFLEVKGGTANLYEMKKAIPVSDQPSGKGQDLKVIIRRFSMDSATLNPLVTLIKDQALEPVETAPVTISNIGVRENGIAAGDAVREVIQSLLRSYSKEAGQAGFYSGLSSEALREIGQGHLNSVVEDISNEVDKIGNSLKSIFD